MVEGNPMKVKTILLNVLVVLCLLFISCSDLSTDNNTTNSETRNYPVLRIKSTYEGYIYRVGLVGYSFDDLRIENNETKTFELKNGIPGGNNNVNVNITFRPDSIHMDSRSPLSVKCNFQNGKTTTITIPAGTVSLSD